MIGANQQLRLYRAALGTERDEFGRRVQAYGLADVFLGNLFERFTRELVDGQWTTVGEWVCYVPPGITVTHRDQLEDLAGNRYRIQSATPRRGPTGAVHHTACVCIRVEE